MPDIMHLLKIHASPERVYQALTTPEDIRNWWTRDADLDSKIGGTGEFRFYDGKSVTKVRIEELEPPARVAWKTLSSFRPEWGGTTITFGLRAEGSDTVLSFAHRGFEKADEGYAATTTGWGYYLISLQQYLETGKGAPTGHRFRARYQVSTDEIRPNSIVFGSNSIVFGCYGSCKPCESGGPSQQ